MELCTIHNPQELVGGLSDTEWTAITVHPKDALPGMSALISVGENFGFPVDSKTKRDVGLVVSTQSLFDLAAEPGPITLVLDENTAQLWANLPGGTTVHVNKLATGAWSVPKRKKRQLKMDIGRWIREATDTTGRVRYVVLMGTIYLHTPKKMHQIAISDLIEELITLTQHEEKDVWEESIP